MKTKLRIAINLFTAIAPFAAWLSMMGIGSGALTSRGLPSLKYFTVLSNLLEGIASVIWILSLHAPEKKRHRAEIFKFIACLGVFLTFATVMVFLGPLFGYASMFAGVNFWLHLVVPLAALLETVFLVRERISLKETGYTMLPPLIYGCFYLGNILLHGRGDQTHWNDFYGFAAWGIPAGLLIFAGICLLVFVTALALRKIASR